MLPWLGAVVTEGMFGAAMMKMAKHSRAGKAARREGVTRSAEFRRIAALPRRKLQGSIDVEGLSAMLRLPDGHPNKCKGCKYCVNGNMTLFPDQAYALQELHDYGGAFIGMEVGSGKALITLLGPRVVNARRPLVMVPAGVKDQTINDVIPAMRRHWQIPDNIMVGTYEQLSTVNGKDYLTDRMPDWVFPDEAHKLQDEDNARGSRFMRHFIEYPDTKLVPLSGSFFDRTLRAFAHLIRLALNGMTPIPIDKDELEKWCLCLDSKVDADNRYSPGALLDFVEYLTQEEIKACKGDELNIARFAVGARMAETPGVVFSSAQTVNIPIIIREANPGTIPKAVSDAFEALRETWETPRGDVITDAVHLYRIVTQLAQGFFYRWVWPKGPDGKEIVNHVWKDARKNWHRFVRTAISRRSHHGVPLDSYKEVENCCVRYERYIEAKAFGIKDVIDELRDSHMIDSQDWRNWLMVRGQYVPVTEVVWIDRFLAQRAAEWLNGPVPGIAWVGSTAMGEAIRAYGYRYYRGGEDEIIYETVSCAAAVKAHSFGKNLQHFHRGLVITPMTKGKDWEQLIGRYHRSGQKSSIVSFDVFMHVRELWSGFWQAERDAEFAQFGSRSAQRLCLASIEKITDADAFPLRCLSDDPLWRFSGKP